MPNPCETTRRFSSLTCTILGYSPTIHPQSLAPEGRAQIYAALAKILIKSSSTVKGKQLEDLKIVEDVAEVDDVKKAAKGYIRRCRNTMLFR